ncbi:hypothetical protein NL676_023323, partial [Syzygium grande]
MEAGGEAGRRARSTSLRAARDVTPSAVEAETVVPDIVHGYEDDRAGFVFGLRRATKKRELLRL